MYNPKIANQKQFHTFPSIASSDTLRIALLDSLRQYKSTKPVDDWHAQQEDDDSDDKSNSSSDDTIVPISNETMHRKSASDKGITKKEQQRIGKSVAQLDVITMENSITKPWRSGHTDHNRGSAWFLRLPHEPKDKRTGQYTYPPKYLATCYHCVADAMPKKGITIRTASTKEQKIPARVVAIMPEIDAAILEILPLQDRDREDNEQVDTLHFTAWPLGDDKKLRMQEKLSVFGYPLGQDNLKSVTSILNGRQDGKLQLDGAINHGHSGGPVVHQDQVIGWITSGDEFANNVSFAEPISVLTGLLPEIQLRNDDSDDENNGNDSTNKQKQSTQIIHKGSLGINYFNSNKDRMKAIGARSDVCNKEDPCPCESGVVLQWISQTSDLKKPPFNAQPGDILCAITATMTYDGKTEKMQFKISDHGKIAVPWDEEKIFLSVLLSYIPKKEPITVNIWKSQEKKLVTGETRLKDNFLNGFLNIHFPYETLDYENFAGLVVEPMNASVLSQFPRLAFCLSNNEKEEPHVVLVNILDASEFDKTETIFPGSIIKTVNDRPVTNMKEYREAIQAPLDDKYMSIVTLKDNGAIVSMDEIIRTEPFLAEQHKYPLSDIFKQFTNHYPHVFEQK